MLPEENLTLEESLALADKVENWYIHTDYSCYGQIRKGPKGYFNIDLEHHRHHRDKKGDSHSIKVDYHIFGEGKSALAEYTLANQADPILGNCFEKAMSKAKELLEAQKKHARKQGILNAKKLLKRR